MSGFDSVRFFMRDGFLLKQRRIRRWWRAGLWWMVVWAFVTPAGAQCRGKETTQKQIECLENLLRQKADAGSVVTPTKLKSELQNVNQSVDQNIRRSEADAKA